MPISVTPGATFALIDVQKEYTTPGRPFHLAGVGPSLANCRALLAARGAGAGVRIIHVRHVQDGPVFGRGAPESGFIEGFTPEPGEIEIEKSALSCYSNPRFAALIDEAQGAPVYVAGYGSTMCCLATVAAAPLFGHRLHFVHDASWARAGGGLTEAEMHRGATAILAIHGAQATAASAMATFAAAARPASAAA